MGTDRTGPRPRLSRTTPGSPTRTCVGCRGADSWSALLRVVAEKGEQGQYLLVPDPWHRLPGRGAWLHPTGECLHLAVRRRAFGRALRVSAGLDSTAVTAYVEAVSSNRPQQGTESGF